MAQDESITPPPLPVSTTMPYNRHTTGPIPSHMYPEHISGAITIAAPPPPPPDDFGAFARWWKTAAIVASSLASIGVVVWWVGTKLFVERIEYEADKKKRDETLVEVKTTLQNFQTTLQDQTAEFRGLKDNLQKLNTDLTVLKAVQEAEERRHRRARTSQ